MFVDAARERARRAWLQELEQQRVEQQRRKQLELAERKGYHAHASAPNVTNRKATPQLEKQDSKFAPNSPPPHSEPSHARSNACLKQVRANAEVNESQTSNTSTVPIQQPKPSNNERSRDAEKDRLARRHSTTEPEENYFFRYHERRRGGGGEPLLRNTTEVTASMPAIHIQYEPKTTSDLEEAPVQDSIGSASAKCSGSVDASAPRPVQTLSHQGDPVPRTFARRRFSLIEGDGELERKEKTLALRAALEAQISEKKAREEAARAQQEMADRKREARERRDADIGNAAAHNIDNLDSSNLKKSATTKDSDKKTEVPKQDHNSRQTPEPPGAPASTSAPPRAANSTVTKDPGVDTSNTQSEKAVSLKPPHASTSAPSTAAFENKTTKATNAGHKRVSKNAEKAPSPTLSSAPPQITMKSKLRKPTERSKFAKKVSERPPATTANPTTVATTAADTTNKSIKKHLARKYGVSTLPKIENNKRSREATKTSSEVRKGHSHRASPLPAALPMRSRENTSKRKFIGRPAAAEERDEHANNMSKDKGGATKLPPLKGDKPTKPRGPAVVHHDYRSDSPPIPTLARSKKAQQTGGAWADIVAKNESELTPVESHSRSARATPLHPPTLPPLPEKQTSPPPPPRSPYPRAHVISPTPDIKTPSPVQPIQRKKRPAVKESPLPQLLQPHHAYQSQQYETHDSHSHAHATSPPLVTPTPLQHAPHIHAVSPAPLPPRHTAFSAHVVLRDTLCRELVMFHDFLLHQKEQLMLGAL